ERLCPSYEDGSGAHAGDVGELGGDVRQCQHRVRIAPLVEGADDFTAVDPHAQLVVAGLIRAAAGHAPPSLARAEVGQVGQRVGHEHGELGDDTLHLPA